MLIEIRFQGERLVASFTLEMFESRVCLHVGPEVRPVRECLTAVCTPERLLAGVWAHMSLQEPRSTESLTTHVATVLQVVREYVHGQSRHANVHLLAVGALFGQFTIQATVCLLVSRQVWRGSIVLAAFVTRISLSVGFFGDSQGVSTPWPTVTDKERIVGIANSQGRWATAWVA